MVNMDTEMKGKRVVVTAGAQGIGLAITEAFVAAGAHVHICDINNAFLAEANTRLPGVSQSRTDVTDAAQVDAMFDAIKERWGVLDVLVNNAGIAGGGSIINLSSAAGRLGFPLRSPYSASKFGVIGLTKTWAMELGPAGIRVNAILPGIVAGERQERVIAAKAASYGIEHEAMRQQLLAKVSLRKMVTAQDIANQILFICSPAGASISGQSLSVCGNVEQLG
jgi:NAD(P)-dependent dehydrogenase (short-subunit alcohol dehydrogenase family)